MAAKRWTPDRRDLIWINCSPQTGREMKDFHPLLVLSPKSFNDRTGIVIGLPMTTAEYNETNPFALKMDQLGKKPGYTLAHQPKSFDWRARSAKPHPLKRVPDDLFRLACQALNQIIQIGT